MSSYQRMYMYICVCVRRPHSSNLYIESDQNFILNSKKYNYPFDFLILTILAFNPRENPTKRMYRKSFNFQVDLTLIYTLNYKL